MSQYLNIVARWQSRQLRCTADLDRALQDFNPLFFYHSELLEGRQADFSTVEDYFHTGTVSGFSGDPQALIRLYDQRLCSEYLRERVLARDEMDTPLVLEIHRFLTSRLYTAPDLLRAGERPGELKKQDAHGAPAQEAARELDRLMEELSGYCGADLLAAAAYLHGRFEHIHPFAAGNGATGRVLLNYFLLCRDHPPLVFFSDNRQRYLRCLAAFDESRDVRPLQDLMEEELIRTWGG